MTTRDKGQYVCKAKNPFGQAVSSFEVQVVSDAADKQVPRFTGQLEVSVSHQDRLAVRFANAGGIFVGSLRSKGWGIGAPAVHVRPQKRPEPSD